MRISIILSALLFTLIFPAALFCYPVEFVRLLNPTSGKRVDLIFDAYLPLQQPVKSESESSSITQTQEEVFTPGERALLATLQKLADKKSEGPINLFWEWDPTAHQKAHEKSFISYAGARLAQKFSANQEQSIIFHSGDTYRENSASLALFLAPQRYKKSELQAQSVEAAFKFLFALAQDKNEQIAQDIARIENQDIRKSLQKRWQNYLDQTIKPFYNRYLAPHAQKSLYEFTRLPEYETIKQFFMTSIMATITSYELLFKVFWPAQRVIIYAGALHCSALITMLTSKLYNFIATDAYGTDFSTLLESSIARQEMNPQAHALLPDYLVTLQAGVWPLLAQSTAKMIERNKSNQAHIKLLTFINIRHFFSLIDKKEVDLTLVESMLKRADSAYADLANAIESMSGRTPLHYAVIRDNAALVNLLLQHKARPNVGDTAHGNSPLHEAAKMGNQAIINLLLEYGANPNNSNEIGQKASDLAASSALHEMLVSAQETYEKKRRLKKPATTVKLTTAELKKEEQVLLELIDEVEKEAAIPAVKKAEESFLNNCERAQIYSAACIENAASLLEQFKKIEERVAQKISEIKDFVVQRKENEFISWFSLQELSDRFEKPNQQAQNNLYHYLITCLHDDLSYAIGQSFEKTQDFFQLKQSYLDNQSWELVFNSDKKVNHYLADNPELNSWKEIEDKADKTIKQFLNQFDTIAQDLMPIVPQIAPVFVYYNKQSRNEFIQRYSLEVYNTIHRFYATTIDLLAEMILVGFVTPLKKAAKRQRSLIRGERSTSFKKVKIVSDNLTFIFNWKLIEALQKKLPFIETKSLKEVIDKLP